MVTDLRQAREVLQLVEPVNIWIVIERTMISRTRRHQAGHRFGFGITELAVAIDVPIVHTDVLHVIVVKHDVARRAEAHGVGPIARIGGVADFAHGAHAGLVGVAGGETFKVVLSAFDRAEGSPVASIKVSYVVDTQS